MTNNLRVLIKLISKRHTSFCRKKIHLVRVYFALLGVSKLQVAKYLGSWWRKMPLSEPIRNRCKIAPFTRPGPISKHIPKYVAASNMNAIMTNSVHAWDATYWRESASYAIPTITSETHPVRENSVADGCLYPPLVSTPHACQLLWSMLKFLMPIFRKSPEDGVTRANGRNETIISERCY